MTRCPCCGQPVDTDDLLVSLDANTASRNGQTVHLTPQLAVLAYVLNKARPGMVEHDSLVDAIYGRSADITSEQPKLVARVLLSQNRRLLKSLGVSIVPVYGEGYRMVVE